MQGRRVLYPEGPPSVSDDSILDDPEILGLLRTEWNDGEINAFRKRFKTLTRQPLRERDLKPPSGQWGSEDPATAGLWKDHFATRKPKEPRNKKGNQLAKEVIVIQAGDYHEVTPGVDTILYDELDGSVAGMVIWDFIKDGSVPGTVGHGLVDYIDETICNQGRMLRNSRVSHLQYVFTIPRLFSRPIIL